jgi:hypothetical protein
VNIERHPLRPAGRRSCFYRMVALGGDKAKLVFD